jgi:hypothetical protein
MGAHRKTRCARPSVCDGTDIALTWFVRGMGALSAPTPA